MEMDEKKLFERIYQDFHMYAQEESIQTNYIKYNIHKTDKSPRCMMCGTRNETMSQILSVCDKLTQKEYKWGYDSVGRYVY